MAVTKIWKDSYHQEWPLRQIWINTSDSNLFYASAEWHTQKSDQIKMKCFQNKVFKWVTPRGDSHFRINQTNTLPVQMFWELNVSLFFKKIVNDCLSFNLYIFISLNQGKHHNLWHGVVYCYKTILPLSEEKFFCRTSLYANILAKKYSIETQTDPILFTKGRNFPWDSFFRKCKYIFVFQLLKSLCRAHCVVNSQTTTEDWIVITILPGNWSKKHSRTAIFSVKAEQKR